MNLTDDMIRKQSEAAYGQWAKQWREHSKIHSKWAMKPMADFQNIGIGKAIVCVANGWSFEREIETLKEMQGNVDILCCDKSLGHLIRNGIKPTYCMVCDANVNYEKYLQPYEKELGDTILFNNVCGNTTWTERGNWKDVYFFVNKDILGSEREFMALSGCPNVIPAGTNVSNAMVVLLAQSDNDARRNFFGYDKILLIGYDYCWVKGGHYYAFDENGGGKENYMRHIYVKTAGGDLAYTSNNLAFSASWLEKYVKVFKLPVVQCSKDSIFLTPKRGVLSSEMRYTYKRADGSRVCYNMAQIKEMREKIALLQMELDRISADHYLFALRN